MFKKRNKINKNVALRLEEYSAKNQTSILGNSRENHVST